MAGGEKTSRGKTDSDKSRKILWKRRYFQMQEESNKEILQKRSDGCMIGPKVKALYTKREVGKVDKQSADDRENTAKTVIAFPKVEDPCFDNFLDAFSPEVPIERRCLPKERESITLVLNDCWSLLAERLFASMQSYSFSHPM